MIDLDALLARLKMVMDTHPDDGGQVLLADGVEDCYEAITRLRADLAQRTAERDEARRWLCRKSVYAERKPHDSVDSTEAKVLLEAQMRGWDCFEKEANNAELR